MGTARRLLVMLAFAVMAPSPARARPCDVATSSERAYCFTQAALDSGDSSFCLAIEGDLSRDACLSAVSRATGESACARIEGEFARSDCALQGAVGRQELIRRGREEEPARWQLELMEQGLAQQRQLAADLKAQLEAQRAFLEAQLSAQHRLERALAEQRAALAASRPVEPTAVEQPR